MPAKDISALRKSGQLNEALAMAEAEWQAEPEGIWPKRNISWVYYDFLKSHISKDGLTEFEHYLTKIHELQLPSSEAMFFDQLSFQVGKMVFVLAAEQSKDTQAILRIFELIREMHFTKPSKGYSFLFKSFHKALKDTNQYCAFVDWWGLDNFSPEDFELERLQDGREVMAIVEQAYIAYAKKLLKQKSPMGEELFDEEKANQFVPRLSKIIEERKQYQYPPYFLAKLYADLGEHQKMKDYLLPFARKKSNDFWVWDLLSESLQGNDELVFACYCKALLCKSPEEMLVSLRQRMAKALVERKLYGHAKKEIELLTASRSAKGYNIPREVLNWMESDWFKSANAPANNRELYLQYANEAESLLYEGIPEVAVIVEFVNKDKHIMNFIASENQYGFLKYDRFLKNARIGETYLVRFQGGGEVGGRYLALTMRPAENQELKSQFIKSIEGAVQIKEGKSFGFVDRVYIPQNVIKHLKISNGDRIKGTAIKTYNKEKSEWGWKLMEAEML